MIFNYLFGRIVGKNLLWLLFKKRYWEFKAKIDRFGGIVLFLGNILPGPIELLAVFYGGFKFSFFRYVYLVFMGRLIKFILLFIAFYFFWDQLVLYYSLLLDHLTLFVESFMFEEKVT